MAYESSRYCQISMALPEILSVVSDSVRSVALCSRLRSTLPDRGVRFCASDWDLLERSSD